MPRDFAYRPAPRPPAPPRPAAAASGRRAPWDTPDHEGYQPGPMAPQAPGRAPGAGYAPAPPPVYDYSGDPVLAGIRNSATSRVTGSRGKALGDKRNLLLRLGDKNLARSVLGEGDPLLAQFGDAPTESSLLGQLANAYKNTVETRERSLNNQNLFYGGHRIKQLGDLATENTTDRDNLFNQTMHGDGGLDAVDEWLRGEEGTYRDTIRGGEDDAYDRAVQWALKMGLGVPAHRDYAYG